MKVVLLVGGRGIRLAGEDAPLPKALFSIGGQPIVYHIMRTFATRGIGEFVLALGYRGEQIVDYFLHQAPFLQTNLRLTLGGDGDLPRVQRLSGPSQSWEVTLAHTGADEPTGERLRRVREYLDDDERFIVTYGDGLADLDPRELIEFHGSHDRAGTVTVVRARSQFGHVSFGAGHVVEELVEKPPLPGWINGAFSSSTDASSTTCSRGTVLRRTACPGWWRTVSLSPARMRASGPAWTHTRTG